jgi:hypothetical protein
MSLELEPDRLVRDAALATIAYADIFDFAVSSAEIHRDLVHIGAAASDVEAALDHAVQVGQLTVDRGYLALTGREIIVQQRIDRRQANERMWQQARIFGRILGTLPFARLVGITGSLAADNAAPDADIDYLIIAAPRRVWLVRALAIAVVRYARLRGITLCPNYLLSTDALELPHQDLYTAHELLQLVPLCGPATYLQLRVANRWADQFLPNRAVVMRDIPTIGGLAGRLKVLGEWVLGGSLGESLDDWESRRKIARFRGVGTPGRFTREVCEGHFGHHRDRVLREWRDRCERLGVGVSFDSERSIPLVLAASTNGSSLR